MTTAHVRRFDRADRDQLTDLVNAHVAAVVPNVSVSVSGLLSDLEREPDEFIVDRWVTERLTLVAEQRQRIVAAAHLLRYADDDAVSDWYRGAGEIRWLLFWRDASHWPGSEAAGELLMAACVAQLARWSVRRCHADGALPAPGVYGVPEQWPHVRDAYHRAGFRPSRAEAVFVARVGDLPRRTEIDLPGVTARRTLGINGTRISAVRGNDTLGYLEVASLDRSPRTVHTHGWADIGDLHVTEDHRRTGVGTWLLAQAADWLELGEVTRLLSYTDDGDDDAEAFHRVCGFRRLTRTICGLSLVPGQQGSLPTGGA